MAKSPGNSIRMLCRQRIAALCPSLDATLRLDDRVVRLVEENIASGRYQRIVASRSKHHPLGLAEYVNRVIGYASNEHARIRALENGEPNAWNRLRDFLHRRAIPMVQRFRYGSEVIAEALDFAQQTCVIVFNERYPCDVSFDAWATTILKNLVLAHYTRSTDALNQSRAPESLDRPSSTYNEDGPLLGELFATPSSLAPFEKVENQILLLDAIDQLRSQAQRQVIVETYLEELDDIEIARRLGKSVQAVYNLRQRALKQLREILTQASRKKAGRNTI